MVSGKSCQQKTYDEKVTQLTFEKYCTWTHYVDNVLVSDTLNKDSLSHSLFLFAYVHVKQKVNWK